MKSKILIFIFLILFSNVTAQKENSLGAFNLSEPIQKTEFYYLYKNLEIFFNQTPQYQSITLKSNDRKEQKKLEDYFENQDIEFYLYENEKFNEKILIVEGNDFYEGNFGVYFINKKLNLFKLDLLSYDRKDAEELYRKFSSKIIKTNNFTIECQFLLGNEILYEKKYDINEIK